MKETSRWGYMYIIRTKPIKTLDSNQFGFGWLFCHRFKCILIQAGFKYRVYMLAIPVCNSVSQKLLTNKARAIKQNDELE